MPRRPANACDPSGEFIAVIDLITSASTLKLLHSLARAEAATAADLAHALDGDRAVVERDLRSLEAIGLVDRAARAPLPSIWAVRVEEVQRAGLAWIAFATGNPDRTSTAVPIDGSCCEPRRSAP